MSWPGRKLRGRMEKGTLRNGVHEVRSSDVGVCRPGDQDLLAGGAQEFGQGVSAQTVGHTG